MFSNIFSVRPNPNYVPGGTENFWVSDNMNPPEKKRDQSQESAQGGFSFTVEESVKMRNQDEVTKVKKKQLELFTMNKIVFNTIFHQNI